jgi:RNA polymerase sigma-70 factor (ECF subfamily)
LDQWFVREVLVHQRALLQYLRRLSSSNPEYALDIMQESLTRLYSAAKKERPDEPRKYLFTIARNIFLDEIRRAKIVTIETVANLDDVKSDREEFGLDNQVSIIQEWRLLQNAMEKLPKKCQKVVEMRRIDGFSQRETAENMGISEASVEAHIRRGIRHLAMALRDVSPSAKAYFTKNNLGKRPKETGKAKS